MSRIVSIVGASARAAAQSAIRAGFIVHAGDLFADVDLARDCDATLVAAYPAGLAAVLRGAQAGGWLYTGALENEPALVDRLQTVRPLWGNSGEVLRRVRNPALVAEALDRAGFDVPAVACEGIVPPGDGSWLRKPRLSAGGMRVSKWESLACEEAASTYYFQQFVEGESYSATYVAADGRAVLLGVTRQLIGQGWAGVDGFRYCGSVGPIELRPPSNRFAEIGSVLAAEFGLVGLFGVDAIVNQSGVWPVEVNPRYTASVEVLERAFGFHAIAFHIAACESSQLPVPDWTVGKVCCGKAVIFAANRMTMPEGIERVEDRQSAWPELADIPATGTSIESGWPILTVIACGTDERAVLENLQRNAAEIRTRLVQTATSLAKAC